MEWSVTKLGDLPRLIKQLGAAQASSWPGKARPQGFIFEIAQNIGVKSPDGRTALATAHGPLFVDGSVFRPGYTTQGPFAIIGLVAAASLGAVPSVVQAYLHPLANDTSLFLVDSGLERDVFREIRLGLFKRSNGGERYAYRITKPTIDWSTTQGACRPDFIVDMGDQRHVIEVMGLRTDAYFESKESTHPKMRELATRQPWVSSEEEALVLIENADAVAPLLDTWAHRVGQSKVVPTDPFDRC